MFVEGAGFVVTEPDDARMGRMLTAMCAIGVRKPRRCGTPCPIVTRTVERKSGHADRRGRDGAAGSAPPSTRGRTRRSRIARRSRGAE